MKLNNVRKSLFEFNAVGCSKLMVDGNGRYIQISNRLFNVQSKRFEVYTKCNKKRPQAYDQHSTKIGPIRLNTNGGEVTDWSSPVPWKTEIKNGFILNVLYR